MRRHRHGALTLESVEAKAVFDGDVLLDGRDLGSELKRRGAEVGRITSCPVGKTTSFRFSAMVLPVTVRQSPCR